jgi:hypothetical protein
VYLRQQPACSCCYVLTCKLKLDHAREPGQAECLDSLFFDPGEGGGVGLLGEDDCELGRTNGGLYDCLLFGCVVPLVLHLIVGRAMAVELRRFDAVVSTLGVHLLAPTLY